MGQGSSGSVPTLPPNEGNSESKHVPPGPEPATQPLPTSPVRPSNQPVTAAGPTPTALDVPRRPGHDTAPADAPGQQATVVRPRVPGAAGAGREAPLGGLNAAPLTGAVPAGSASSEVVRYGPGVPVGEAVGGAAAGAESVWRTGQRAGPGMRRGGRRGRVRRVASAAVTVALLAAAGVVVWLRFFDHPPLRVTRVAITQQTAAGCTVDVTGRIDTNGSAGTVSYQWVFRPQAQTPQPLNQSVSAGQRAVYVTVAVQGRGHGTATQAVTPDVLGPGTGTATQQVTISC